MFQQVPLLYTMLVLYNYWVEGLRLDGLMTKEMPSWPCGYEASVIRLQGLRSLLKQYFAEIIVYQSISTPLPGSAGGRTKSVVFVARRSGCWSTFIHSGSVATVLGARCHILKLSFFTISTP